MNGATMTWTLAALQASMPWIPWLEPLRVLQSPEGSPRYACRICIARHGLRGADVPTLPATEAEAREHIELHHRGERGAQ